MKQLVCPISAEKVNERLTRVNALFTILLVAAGFYYESVWFPLLLSVDFFIRAFGKSHYSPVNFTSSAVVRILQLGNKPTDKAPKIFAARLGFVMTFIVALLVLAGFNTASIVVAGVLIMCAALELAFGICLGCYVYSYLVLPAFKE